MVLVPLSALESMSTGMLLVDLAQAGFRESHMLCVSASGVDEEERRRGVPGYIAFWSW